MLDNPLGVLLYLLLPNDISWKLLPPADKQAILEANRSHNVGRDDYAEPEKYGAGRKGRGENWDSFVLTDADYRAQALLRILEKNRPERVLEVGPGGGFHTRLLCEYRSVNHYCAVDIGQSFLEYLEPRLKALSEKKSLCYELVCGEFTQTELAGSYDMIMLFSAVHHIPNRTDLFGALAGMLAEGGVIFCFDPSHYLPRFFHLLVKSFASGYLRPDFYGNKGNLSTHHMCTLGEYRRIVRRIPEIRIEETICVLPKRLRNYRRMLVPNLLFSSEMGVVFRKSGAGRLAAG
jgi:SAM-dependent methyltransferase